MMNNKEIIFFDDLGYGWVVDKNVIKEIRRKERKERRIIEKTLVELLKKDERV